ncbi:hypothetical protein [Anaeromicrobium sediminis]|uniref:Tetratricopeptide repeat protein n=1 Tax=Anaeromicrobium sediminis TaxID=1478221 RepID=A0A267MGR8_9FIRM|nr:hypothetical protein [Anaeromicrobium sediminis]PAB58657.1 hypothetical protein CCE28_14345 [Anaeromicrobium sediminis]
MKRIGITILILIILTSNAFAYGNKGTINIEIKDDKIHVMKDENNKMEKIISEDIDLDRLYIPIEIKRGENAKFRITFNKSIDPQNLYFHKEDIVNNPNFYVDIKPDEGIILIEGYELKKNYNLLIEYEEYFKNKLNEELVGKKANILELIKYYEEKKFEDFINKSNNMELNNDQDDESLKLKYIVEYYNGRVSYEMRDYEKAIENFKTGDIIENRNIYYNTIANKELGNMDKALVYFKKALNENDKNGIYIWAKKEIENLPEIYKEKLSEKEIHKKPIEKNKFSYRGFLMMNSGIFILFLVLYHNIKKS